MESVVKWGNHPSTQKWGGGGGECHMLPYLRWIGVHVPVTWLGANGGGFNVFQKVLRENGGTMWQKVSEHAGEC